MRKREADAYNRYNQSTMYSLDDAYDSYSGAKARAWIYCRDLCEGKNGHALKVISKNTSQFTAGFVYEENGKEMFMYITAASDTAAEIDH